MAIYRRWKGKTLKTIGDFVDAVLMIDNEADAKQFYDQEVVDIQRQIDVGEWKGECRDAATNARANIGWCYGEGMSRECVEMWVRVCKAAHPVFGMVTPSPEEAFRMGQVLGSAE